MGYDPFAAFDQREKDAARLKLRVDIAANGGDVGLLKGRGAVLVGDFGVSWAIASSLRHIGGTLPWRKVAIAGRVDRFIQHGVSLRISGDTVTDLAIQTDSKGDCDKLVQVIEEYLSQLPSENDDDNDEDDYEDRQRPLTLDEVRLIMLWGGKPSAYDEPGGRYKDVASCFGDVSLRVQDLEDAELLKRPFSAISHPLDEFPPSVSSSYWACDGWPVYIFDARATALCADHCRLWIRLLRIGAIRDSIDIDQMVADFRDDPNYLDDDDIVEAVDGVIAMQMRISDDEAPEGVDDPGTDRFSRLFRRYYNDAAVQAIVAASDDDQAERAVQRSQGAVNDVLQRAAGGWLTQLREENEDLVSPPPRWQELGSSLYTVVLAGWTVGAAWKDNQGVQHRPVDPEEAEHLGEVTVSIATQFSIDELDDVPFYCLANLRGIWINGTLLKPFDLDFTRDNESASVQLLWSVGHVALTWGFCLSLAETRLAELE